MGLDPARDELSFFPVIYWPMAPGAPRPSQLALERIDAYMKRGGTVIFDTRDAVDVRARRRNARTRHGAVALDFVVARHPRARADAAPTMC